MHGMDHLKMHFNIILRTIMFSKWFVSFTFLQQESVYYLRLLRHKLVVVVVVVVVVSSALGRTLAHKTCTTLRDHSNYSLSLIRIYKAFKIINVPSC